MKSGIRVKRVLMNIEKKYESLKPENFVCLSWNMHKVVHALFVKSKPMEWRKRVLNLIKILKKMEKLNSKST